VASSRWTPGQLAQVREWTEQGLNSLQIADKFAALGVTPRRTQKSVQRVRERHGWHVLTTVPRARTPRFNKALKVKGPALVLADVHAPFHDAKWINQVCDLAVSWGIERCILAGDLADFNAFSSFGRDVGIDGNAELDTLADVVDALCAQFEVYYFAGNHDVRPLRTLQSTGLTVDRIMRLFIPGERCHISDYHWCELSCGGTTWHVEHPKNASVIPARVAQGLAVKFNRSVIAGHGHLWGITRDVSNRHWCIDSGICADPMRMGYVQQRHSTRPMMCQGAVIVTEEGPVLLSPDNIGFYQGIKRAA